MSDAELKRRLRWRARCGMLELDMLFTNFVDDGYDQLTQHEKQLFDLLIDEEADVLYGWIFGNEQAPSGELNVLISKIHKKKQ